LIILQIPDVDAGFGLDNDDVGSEDFGNNFNNPEPEEEEVQTGQLFTILFV
jgi:hypothetical protein